MAKDEESGENHKEIWKDPRFAHLVTDPRFKGIPKSQKKVKIDKRFQSMFKDEKFKVKETVDKYGRKVKKSTNEDLKKYYDLDEESSDDEEERKKEELAISKEDQEGSEDDLPVQEEDESIKKLPDKVKSRLKDLEIDYARGEGKLVTDSSSDEDSEEEGNVVFDHVWGDLDADADRTDESTKRLAICNMDWDRIRALDILVLLNSFLPRGSGINSITIYPSEFGKERMKEEEKAGPIELRKDSDEEPGSESEKEEEDEETKTERLREYQLNRLKYYYAVVECDSVETADKLYKECDGLEYESTANKLDLRFIPDDMEFEDEPKDKITELPDLSKYEPRMFTTSALTQGKVELTWDENDLDRKEFNDKLMNGKFDKLSDAELKKYVACSSEEEEDEEKDGVNAFGSDESDEEEDEKPKKNLINKYKALLNDIKEKEEKSKKDKIEMEFSWDVNKDNEDKDVDPDVVSEMDNINPFEKKLEKIKEKRKRRKEMKKKKRRGEIGESEEEESSDEELPYDFDLNDPFFKDAYDEDMQDKKAKKKSKKKIEESEDEEEKERKKAELALLLEDDDDEEDKEHFNLAKIQESEIDLQKVSKSKRKRILKKSKKEIEASKKKFDDGFKIDADDNRFMAVFSNPAFNIDPTDPHFKKTKGMETLIQEKLKKRTIDHDGESVDAEAKKSKLDSDTSLLVKNLKKKVGKQVF